MVALRRFALPVPVLIAGGYYRSFAVAVLSALVLGILAWLVFGTLPWLQFIDNLLGWTQVVGGGELRWQQMPTLYASARAMGAASALATGVQALGSLACAVVAIMLWRRDAGVRALALLPVLICLSAPYALVYDLALCVPALALWAATIRQRGWHRFERLGYVAAALFPAMIVGAYEALGWSIGAMGVAALAGAVLYFVKDESPYAA